jgi:uncharacterized coiled-coil protein SlyX
MARFGRKHDDIDELLAETHETVGRMHTLLDQLSDHIAHLETTLNSPPEEKGAPS